MKQLLQQVLFYWKNDEFIRSKETRRQYFLGVFILICSFFNLYILIFNIFQFITNPTPLMGVLVGIDFVFLLLLSAMFLVSNTRINVQMAYVLLIGINLAITFLFPLTNFSNILFLYALPTLGASFLIRGWVSFPFALLSISCYLVTNLLRGAPNDINHLFIGGIIMLAIVSWYVAARLEHAMTVMYRSEEKYQSLVDQNPLCVYEIEGGRTGSWIYVNSRITDLTGYTPLEWLAQPEFWAQHIAPADRERVINNANANLSEGETYSEEYQLVRKDGRIVYVSDTYSITKESGQPVSIQGVLENITPRKHAEMAQAAIYRISQAAYIVDTPDQLYPLIHSALADLMPVNNFYIALYSPEDNLIHFPYFVDEVDVTPGSKPPGQGLTEYVLRHGQPLFARPEVFDELTANGEVQSVGAPSVDWLGVPLKVRERTIGVMALQSYTEGVRFDTDDLEILTFVSTQVAMVIERKRAEAALHYSENVYHTTIDSLDEFVHMVDTDLRLVMANQSFKQFNQKSGGPDSLEGHHLSEVVPFLYDPEPLKAYKEILSTGERKLIIDRRRIGTEDMVTEVHMVPVIENGKVERVISLTRNITQQKIAEDQIKAALREKEVLLREIHHRVKNNLQVMSSLLSLEMDYITDPQAQHLFAETQSRVRTMALIHEELYQSKNLAQVNFSDYINKLANNLMQIFAIHHNVQLKVDVDEVYLGVDTAIPCGLIINELMTNALKYAFPNNRPGTISISLSTCTEPGQTPCYRLIVQDDGIGFPPDFDINTTSTLGLQLVNILISQLKGQLKIASDQGTRFTLTFTDLSAGAGGRQKESGESK